METVDVSAIIDQEKPGAFHWSAFALCAALLVFDGFDSQAAGYAAPSLARDLHLDHAALGPLFSLGNLGFTVGALVFGVLADRFGRRAALISCVLFFGVFSLATVWAGTLGQVMVLRFLAGLGVGGAMPNAIALISEYFPSRIRATVMMLGSAGYALGSALCGMVGAWLVPSFGWQSLFVVGGVGPLLLLGAWVLFLPESIRFLVVRTRDPARIRAMLARMYPSLSLPADALYTMPEMRRAGFTVAHLFRDGRALGTVLLWVGIFCNLLVLSFLLNWLPTLATGAGMPMAQAIAATSMFSIGGIFGAALLGRPMDRFGPQPTLAGALLCVAIPIASVGFAAGSFGLLSAVTFLIGFFVAGSNAGGTALAGLLYPTFMRSTGVGWALGIGRSAAFIAPLIGSAFLAWKLSLTTMFVAAAGAELVAAAAYMAMTVLRPLARRPYASPGAVVETSR